ncbi:MAG: hypothetical protein MI755_14320 [Sphingomonadales bacterium]|nr:hypothetical protein [Sphingomonadales bacterium]
MSDDKTLTIDAYPWAQPTEEQKRYFDSLSPSEQRAMLEDAIERGLASGISKRSVADIISAAKADIENEEKV